MNDRRVLVRLWDRVLEGSERAWDFVLDGAEGARERVSDAIASVRDVLHDGWVAVLGRLAGLGRVSATASVVVAIALGVVVLRFAASSGGEPSLPPRPAPVLRSPVSLPPAAPRPAPSLLHDQ